MKLDTQEKILDFTNLEVGWHFGEGNPPTSDAIEIALQINAKLVDVLTSETDAFPGAFGEIQVNGYIGSKVIEFVVETNCEITYVMEISGVEIEYKENLTLKQCLDIIEGEVWGSLESSIQRHTIEDYNDLLVSHLVSRQMVGFQSSTLNVLKELVDAFVNTLYDSTKTTQEIPQYSLESPRMKSLPIAHSNT